jgi:hypothetical protein
MAAMSDTLEVALINHIFRGTAYTAPATLGVALATATISDTDTTLAGKEVSGSNAYARVAVVSNTSNWTAAVTNGTTSNVNAIVFPTATGDWGTITHVAICDSTTTQAGNVLFYGALASNKIILNGDTFQFNANSVTIQIDG